jgi:hypothetical protein
MVDVGQTAGAVPAQGAKPMAGQTAGMEDLRNIMNDVYLAYESSVMKQKGVVFTSEDLRALVATVFINKFEQPRGGSYTAPRGNAPEAKQGAPAGKPEELKIVADQAPVSVKFIKSYPYGSVTHYGKNESYKFDVEVDGVPKELFMTKRNGDVAINHIGKTLTVSSVTNVVGDKTYYNYSIKDGDVELMPKFGKR